MTVKRNMAVGKEGEKITKGRLYIHNEEHSVSSVGSTRYLMSCQVWISTHRHVTILVVFIIDNTAKDS